MLEVAKISAEEVLIIKAIEESQRLDFKSVRISPAKLSETISSFANTDGGEIYVGIEDNKDWQGFHNQEDANAVLAILFDMFPVQDYMYARFLESEDEAGLVLKIEVFRSLDVKIATNGNPYKRFGAQNRKLKSREEIQRLEYSKGVHSYEDELLTDTLEEVVNSKSVIEFSLNIVPHPEPVDWLKKQKLIRGDRATVAAYLLFSDEPQVELPKAAIKVYRYRTADPEGNRDSLAFDPITIDGSATEQIVSAVRLTKEKVQDIPKIGAKGLEAVVYPEEAIHEVITNAVLHRDYSSQDEVHVRIFDNRIEIFSPGKLPGYVTVKNILSERFARNPKLVRIVNKFPDAPNKDIGEGLNTTFEKMRDLKLRDPVIKETDAGVTVLLYHELLASPEELIQDYLQKYSEINNSKAREICREGSENKMKRVFERMMASDIIERIPDRKGRATAYRLKN